MVNALFNAQEIIDFQNVIPKLPVADNVIEYAVTLVSKTRPDNPLSNEYVKRISIGVLVQELLKI